MDIQDPNLIDLIRFQANRHIINLYKKELTILEWLEQNNRINKDEKTNLRKEILDFGNDSIREFEEFLEKIKNIVNIK